MFACRLCRRPFFICPACYRGHAYCSPPCRREGRARSLRAARRKLRQSPEGRLDHCDRQRAYRARRRAGVTHQGRELPPACGSLSPRPPATPPAGLAPSGPGGSDAQRRVQAPRAEAAPRCLVCGRRSEFVQWVEDLPRRARPRGGRAGPAP